MPYIPSTGCTPSKYDLRTFTFSGVEAPLGITSGGKRYDLEDIENQSLVGICTAISLTQNANKAVQNTTNRNYSADFQYLLQKKFIDKNWFEGSSIFSALQAGKTYGLLPEQDWKWTMQEDREKGYAYYMAKLKAIPDAEIERLLTRTEKIITAYASVPVTRDAMARAIYESKSGILSRFELGKEWYTDKWGNLSWNKDDIEPLRKPQIVVSGHAVTECNFAGNSFRVANTWGDWAD